MSPLTYTLPKKYQNMTEADIQAALADRHDSQIIQELASLMELYAKQIKNLVRAGENPETALKPQSCALEDMALRMVVDAARPAAAKKV
ncbi:MAG: hypothetical protein Q8K65_02615 [Alphaproteobacteria bacterium]|nr:hypothetical protein [Alphaproteobacteria bacterium]